jgi:hypothetical protein
MLKTTETNIPNSQQETPMPSRRTSVNYQLEP